MLYCRLELADIVYLCTKFDHSSRSCSRDVVGAHQNVNGLRDLTTPLLAFCSSSSSSLLVVSPFSRITTTGGVHTAKGV